MQPIRLSEPFLGPVFQGIGLEVIKSTGVYIYFYGDYDEPVYQKSQVAIFKSVFLTDKVPDPKTSLTAFNFVGVGYSINSGFKGAYLDCDV